MFTRRIPVLAALLLASCVAGPTPGTSLEYYPGGPPAYGMQPQPTLSSVPASGRTVRYAGRGDSILEVQMTSIPGGHMRVSGSTMGNRVACGGGFEGTGAFQGNRMVVRDNSNPACEITLVRTGRRLAMSDGESMACFSLHGAQCSFNGQLTQR